MLLKYIKDIIDLSRFHVRKAKLEARLATWYCVGDELELTLIKVKISQSSKMDNLLARGFGALYEV